MQFDLLKRREFITLLGGAAARGDATGLDHVAAVGDGERGAVFDEGIKV